MLIGKLPLPPQRTFGGQCVKIETLCRKDPLLVGGKQEDGGLEMSIARSLPGPHYSSGPIETMQSAIPAGDNPFPTLGCKAGARVREMHRSNHIQFWVDEVQLGGMSLGEPLRSPPIFALYSPRPPLRGFTKEMGLLPPPKQKPSNSLAIGGFTADFFGAIPVTSALGTAPGATPPRQGQLTMGVLVGHPKPELSTLLERGTFYFALTGDIH